MPLHIHYNFLRCQLVYNGKAPNLQPHLKRLDILPWKIQKFKFCSFSVVSDGVHGPTCVSPVHTNRPDTHLS